MKWTQLFKIGKHTDNAGNIKEYTEDDLKEIVNKFNSRTNDIPLVKGHPETDHPAVGWLDNLRINNGVLEGTFKDVTTEFAKALREKAYKYISIALNSDKMLRHIGFLGAANPAVKGLDEVKFSDDEKIGMYQIEFAEKDPRKERSQKYNISVTGNEGKLKDGYIETDYADPVNHKFPIKSKQDVISSLSNFNSDWFAKYPLKDQLKILNKVIEKAVAQKVKINPKKWKIKSEFVDIDAEQLTRNQLLDLVKNSIENSLNANNEFINKEGVQDMNFEEFLSLLIDYLRTSFDDDTAQKVEVWLSENKDKYKPETSDEGGEDEASAEMEKKFSEYEKREKTLLERIDNLEAQRVQEKITAFADNLVSEKKIKPAEKDGTVELLVMANKVGTNELEKSMKYFSDKEPHTLLERDEDEPAKPTHKFSELPADKRKEYEVVSKYMEDNKLTDRVQAWVESKQKGLL